MENIKPISKFNQKLAPLINTTFFVGMALDSIATDMKNKRLIKITSKVRELILRAVGIDTADDFGEWCESIEPYFYASRTVEYRRELFFVLCDKFYNMVRQVEQSYRMVDPKFDFYTIKEALQLKEYVKNKPLNMEIYSQVNLVIDKIKKSK